MAAIGRDAHAQIVGVSLGRTSSGVEWLYPPNSTLIKTRSNTDRHSLTIGAAARSEVWSWLSVGSGLRLVPKGFEVTTPTFHMWYLEVPLLGVIQTGSGSGVFVEGGLLLGWRALCRRFMQTVDGFHEDHCGSARTSYGRDLVPIRKWDVSWNAGVGARFPWAAGWLVGALRAQRSVFDIEPAERTKMVNRVMTFSLGYHWRLKSDSEPQR